MSRRRLDEEIAARGLLPSRARARDAILRGTVMVEGSVAARPSQLVGAGASIVLADPARHFVSRAALKLLHALAHFAIDVEGCVCLDIGASTGGFTQVLLEHGARHVTAVDVGYGQLDPRLADDSRVALLERLNARDINTETYPARCTRIVCDVSFISLTLALPPVLALASAGTVLVALIKPQFEAGMGNVGKGGIVREPSAQQDACQGIWRFLEEAGWEVLGIEPSPVIGGGGNREFLIAARKMRQIQGSTAICRPSTDFN